MHACYAASESRLGSATSAEREIDRGIEIEIDRDRPRLVQAVF